MHCCFPLLSFAPPFLSFNCQNGALCASDYNGAKMKCHLLPTPSSGRFPSDLSRQFNLIQFWSPITVCWELYNPVVFKHIQKKRVCSLLKGACLHISVSVSRMSAELLISCIFRFTPQGLGETSKRCFAFNYYFFGLVVACGDFLYSSKPCSAWSSRGYRPVRVRVLVAVKDPCAEFIFKIY